MKKGFSLTLLCLLLAAALAGCAGQQTVTVSVEKDGEILLETEIKTQFETVEEMIEASAADLRATLVDSDYGKYVEGMAGYVADAASNEYWAFYVNGEMSQTGLRDTLIEDGAAYSFLLETY